MAYNLNTNDKRNNIEKMHFNCLCLLRLCLSKFAYPTSNEMNIDTRDDSADDGLKVAANKTPSQTKVFYRNM